MEKDIKYERQPNGSYKPVKVDKLDLDSFFNKLSIVGATGAEGRTPIKDVDYFDGQIGPQGVPGPQGIQGLKGDTGEKGDIGPKGDQGEPGPMGKMGVQGLPGLKGDKGDAGPIGKTGPKGLKGDRGLPGKDGLDGKPGRDGVDGKPGIQGPKGKDGITKTIFLGGGGGTTTTTTTTGTSSTTYSDVRTGVVSGASFSGGLLSYAVTLSSTFSSTNYAVAVTGDNPRVWSISSRTTGGFTIDSNSAVGFTGSVYWVATLGSGSIQSNNRRGIVANTAWYDDTVKKTDIIFTDQLTSTYSVVVSGEDPRSWSVEDVALTGFTIVSNSNSALSGSTFWQCIEI